jgi:bifunctional UDP-N-acetylglucosamine pyrophosphorylase/glucosamine-1-phosphate N-acetyltransferase
MRSGTAKVLHRLAGRCLIDHVLDAALAVAPAERVAVVVGHQAAAVRAHLAPYGVATPVQEPQLGTGHALQVGLRASAEPPDAVLVLSGDVPLLRPATVRRLGTELTSGASAAVLTAQLDTPGAYGRIVRTANGTVARIVEAADADPDELAIHEVNAGIYSFLGAPLSAALAEIAPNNVQGEYYLTDVIERLQAAQHPVGAVCLEDSFEMLGVNSRRDLAEAARVVNNRQIEALMAAGVTVIDPVTTWVDAGCQVGQDTVLEPGVVIRGDAEIGHRSVIGASSVIDGVRVADDTVVAPLSHLSR